MKISKVLCAVNNDPLADSVFEFAYDLAKKMGAEFALVSILDAALIMPSEGGDTVEDLRTSFKKDIHQLFERLLKKVGSPNVARFSTEGDPKKQILAVANDWGADLIVLASHGRGGIARLLVGSVAEAVLRHANCPVLIVPSHRAKESK
jgi:nucleotide-binding universal stress UspA family protein